MTLIRLIIYTPEEQSISMNKFNCSQTLKYKVDRINISLKYCWHILKKDSLLAKLSSRENLLLEGIYFIVPIHLQIFLSKSDPLTVGFFDRRTILIYHVSLVEITLNHLLFI